MKNRVENLFLTKIRATFVLSNVGFPTLIDLTNLTREIPCREARVSSFIYGREPPPGPRVLLRGCGLLLYNNRRRSLHGALPEGKGTQTRFGQGHPAPLPGVGGRTGPFQTGHTDPLPGRGANPFQTGAPGPFAGRGGAYGPFSNRTHGSFAGMAHGAEGSERPGRKAFAAGCKRKERFHAENPIFFSIFASIGKIVNLNAEAV